jgi:hypothetical protein
MQMIREFHDFHCPAHRPADMTLSGAPITTRYLKIQPSSRRHSLDNISVASIEDHCRETVKYHCRENLMPNLF